MSDVHVPGEGGTAVRQLREALAQRVGPSAVEAWFRDVHVDGERAEVTVPVANRRSMELFEQELRQPLELAFRELFGRTPKIVLSIGNAGAAPPAHREHPAPPPPERATAAARLNPRYTFENFIVGPSNRLAHAAAVAVSEKPAVLYNPLFIHGAVGLGKTHLLQAIYQATLARNPHARVAYVPCETFVNEYIDAVRRREPDAFRRKYRSIDLLIVDDVHFLGGKEGSQEEFFHTYNALHMAGKQVVLSSDAPPKDLPSVQERLVSRFASGMVTPIEAPTFEERAAIVRSKAIQGGRALPDEVVLMIAQRIDSNVRELEGVVVRLLALASVCQRPIDAELAAEVLRGTTEPRAAVTGGIPEIQKAVSEYYHLKPSDMLGRRGTRSVTAARQIAIYLARTLTSCSLKEIAAQFGGKDHTTMLYAIRRVENWIRSDARVRADVDYLSRLLRNRLR